MLGDKMREEPWGEFLFAFLFTAAVIGIVLVSGWLGLVAVIVAYGAIREFKDWRIEQRRKLEERGGN